MVTFCCVSNTNFVEQNGLWQWINSFSCGDGNFEFFGLTAVEHEADQTSKHVHQSDVCWYASPEEH